MLETKNQQKYMLKPWNHVSCKRKNQIIKATSVSLGGIPAVYCMPSWCALHPWKQNRTWSILKSFLWESNILSYLWFFSFFFGGGCSYNHLDFFERLHQLSCPTNETNKYLRVAVVFDAGVGAPCSSILGVSKNRGTPKSSILIGFSIINYPFWGVLLIAWAE